MYNNLHTQYLLKTNKSLFKRILTDTFCILCHSISENCKRYTCSFLHSNLKCLNKEYAKEKKIKKNITKVCFNIFLSRTVKNNLNKKKTGIFAHLNISKVDGSLLGVRTYTSEKKIIYDSVREPLI